MTRPDKPMLSTHEGKALMARLAVYAPTSADCELLIQVLRMYFWLVWTVQEAKLSLKRLRSVLFGKALSAPKAPGAVPEAVATVPEPPTPRPAEAASSPSDILPALSGPAPAAPSPKPRGGHRPGTGRLGEAAYPGAARAQCRHEELAAGQRCPVCGQGTFYALPPGVEIRVDGNALLSALRYEVEKLRCSACGEICTASLPPAAGKEK